MSNLQQVAKHRATLDELLAKRADVERQPAAHADILEALDRMLDAESVRMSVNGFERRVCTANDDDALLFARVDATGRINLMPALTALLGREFMRERFEQILKSAPDGITAADRKAQLAALDAEIAKIEVAEERAGRAIEAAGGEFIRRPDASPAIVLAEKL